MIIQWVGSINCNKQYLCIFLTDIFLYYMNYFHLNLKYTVVVVVKVSYKIHNGGLLCCITKT